MIARGSLLAVCTLTFFARNAEATPLSCVNCSELYVVGHPDDDLLFINPDVSMSIQAGNAVRTVVLTACPPIVGGDCNYLDREAGLLEAYAKMAGSSSTTAWSSPPMTINGHTLVHRRLNDKVSVIFLRLVDGTMKSFWESQPPTVATIVGDPQNSYTKADLIATMHGIIADSAAARISTIYTTTSTTTHGDHQTAGYLTQAARALYAPSHRFSMYRDYLTKYFQPNLHEEQRAPKLDFFDVYNARARHAFVIGGDFDRWHRRHYNFTSEAAGSGVISVNDGRCLNTASPPTAGALLYLDSCNTSGALRFTVTADQSISFGDYCVTKSGSNAVMNLCTGDASQKFTMINHGQIRGPGPTCLSTAGGNSLEMGTCIEDGLKWSVGPRYANFGSQLNQFGNAEGTQASIAQTFRLGDLNGDSRADACMRKSDGIYCALNNNLGFDPYTLWTTEFSDPGWSPDKYGTTIQLGDINGDGRADVCGRGIAGIICANANSSGTAFINPSLRSYAFSDAAGWDADPAYYRSIRIADVTGDDIDDVCGRGIAGIYCIHGQSSGTFGTEALWTGTAFTDLQGWLSAENGTTIQLGDINADGRADVCGRRDDGIMCAVSNGSAFIYEHKWSFETEFSDAEGYTIETHFGSIRLGDIDGDGAADLCARRAYGIWCANSNGTSSFSPARNHFPRDFTNALGWAPVHHGATIQLGDLDADGRADLCGRGAARLICAVK